FTSLITTHFPYTTLFRSDSTLLKSKHIPLLASWIDKKDSSHCNQKNNPYEFKLLYRSSKDGTDNLFFHKNCDNKGATIFVAKIQDRKSTRLNSSHLGISY